ncbi:MAG: hypothetical protein GVY31_13455 [Alphaproteobacteria bacterium]|jgi:hypothetical protein|nr:hypothetical protein [Alphaproteobacteria bacterium]
MRWLGLRQRYDRVFDPDGLGGTATAEPSAEDALITRGTLLVEVELVPTGRPVNLVRYSVLDPWPASLSLVQEPDGTLRLLMRLGPRQLSVALRTELATRSDTVIVSFGWDGPGRTGMMSAYVPDTGCLWQTQVPGPFPLMLRDIRRMVLDDAACRCADLVTYFAMAEGLCPAGPMPSLDPQARIETPNGATRLRDLRAGDHVFDSDYTLREICWAGSVTLPAAGRFAPLRMRAPYHGLAEDLILAPDQRLLLAGTEIEYLFGQERVSAAVRHLSDRHSVEPAILRAPFVSYRQILLDQPAEIIANGAAVLSFDAQPLFSDPRLVRHSVLSGLNRENWPVVTRFGVPVLRDYEALTLEEARYG